MSLVLSDRSIVVATVVLVFSMLSSGCGIVDALTHESQEQEEDTGFDDDVGDADAGESTTNACGGEGELLLEGESAEVGGDCGPCSDGIVICDGLEEVRCVQDTAANECGGCEPLPGRVGDPCGPCDSGTYQCDGEGGLECAEADDYNECGGCGELDGDPGWECETAEDVDGVYGCTGPDDIRCVVSGENVCGGGQELEQEPGTSCGECDKGVWACDETDPNEVVCANKDAGVNVCGGCEPLFGVLGDECGPCQGEWACDGPNDVFCDEPERNACGGCEEIDDAMPGELCGDNVVYICENPETLVCPEPDEEVDEPTNACGGSTELDVEPGEVCGPCDDGVSVCVSQNDTGCSGTSELNACGGCANLEGQPGVVCGEGKVWECDENEDRVVCEFEGEPECVDDDDCPDGVCDDYECIECRDDDDCGSGKTCDSEGGCIEPESCKPTGSSCSDDDQCCSSDCEEGICVHDEDACIADYDVCEASFQCCNGACVAGHCEPDKKCAVEGTNCDTDGECCSNHCDDGACVVDECLAGGELCDDDTSCCTNQCVTDDDGDQRCLGSGPCQVSRAPCTGSQDCCNGVCDDGVCADLATEELEDGAAAMSCSLFGDPCDEHLDCCSGRCEDDGRGFKTCQNLGGCRVRGELCEEDFDCCMGRQESCVGPNTGTQQGECKTFESYDDLGRCEVSPGAGSRVDGEICSDIDGWDMGADCCGTCEWTDVGVPRCYGDPDQCISEGDDCAFDDECCGDTCDGGQCF